MQTAAGADGAVAVWHPAKTLGEDKRTACGPRADRRTSREIRWLCWDVVNLQNSGVLVFFFSFIFFSWCSSLKVSLFVLFLLGELSQQSSKWNEEVETLQKSICVLDREKDFLQDEVDQKTEKLVALQDDLSQKVPTSSRALFVYKVLVKEKQFSDNPRYLNILEYSGIPSKSSKITGSLMSSKYQRHLLIY